MGTPISEEEFDRLLAGFERTAFRLETRDTYALGYEQADFDRFLAGVPVSPPEVSWWRPWLDQIARLTAEGKRISRVRVLADPPSDYQRWEMWAAPWHAQAGEDIRYMPRARALTRGVPVTDDWWLLDDERLIMMGFSDTGEIIGKTLVTDNSVIVLFCKWRDLAVRNATPAGEIAA